MMGRIKVWLVVKFMISFGRNGDKLMHLMYPGVPLLPLCVQVEYIFLEGMMGKIVYPPLKFITHKPANGLYFHQNYHSLSQMQQQFAKERASTFWEEGGQRASTRTCSYSTWKHTK
jgi:hypothetical protein